MLIREEDVRSARLILFVDRILENRGSASLDRSAASLSPELQRTFHERHDRLWLRSEEERAIVVHLANALDAWDLLWEAGRDCVSIYLYSLSSSRLRFASIEDGVYQLPSLIAHFLTSLSTYLGRQEEPGHYHFCLEYRKTHSAHPVDNLFIEGLVEGMIRFLRLKEYSLTLLQSSLPEVDSHLKASSDVRWNESTTVYDLTVGQTQHPFPEEEGPTEENTEKFVSRVLKRSQDILQESRELMTAIEYLNIANDELEKKIEANHRQLEMARNIQKGFVPARIPDWKGIRFWVKFFPLQEVSGDFYDYFPIGESKFGLLMCDVSGHGVPAALMSAIAKISFANHRYDSPAETFRQVNLDVLNLVKGEGYLTAFLMVLDDNNRMTYSVAAVPPPMLYRARTNTVQRLEGHGTLLGMFSDAGKHYQDYTIDLEPGDKLFIYSDGLTEAVDPREEMYGEERLIRAIRETRNRNVQQSAEYLMEAYRQFTLGTEPRDDLTFITLMVSEYQDQFDRYVREGHRAFHEGKLEKAVSLLKQAHAIFPKHTHTLFLLGRALGKKGEFEEALEYLVEYLQLKPYNADAYIIAGYCYYMQGNDALAIEYFNRSLNIRKGNPQALYNLIRIFLKQENKVEAKSLFEELVVQRPEHPRVQELRKIFPEEKPSVIEQ
ncbi:MAG: SpoIIE family protein phosphatase [Leptospiraceae bacterium]|nr:SpoIIE family protein phosphatase [Leptospiraceae bacterium]